MGEKDNRTEPQIKLGEVVLADSETGISIKLVGAPEDLFVGDPIIVDGKDFQYFCLIRNIYHADNPIVHQIANSRMTETIPIESVESVRGRIFYSMADLNCLKMISKKDHKTLSFLTIPPYFSSATRATEEEVNQVYIRDPEKANDYDSIGTMKGVQTVIPINFRDLVSKPFAMFGRTGSGKSVLNKLVCSNILHKNLAQLILFDMQGEYGYFSRADNSIGLKTLFEEKVKIFALDPKMTKNADEEFLIFKENIEVGDLVVALSYRGLTPAMGDALTSINKGKGKTCIIDAINQLNIEKCELNYSKLTLQGLKSRLTLFERFPFIHSKADFEDEKKKDSLEKLFPYLKAGSSIVIDFGQYGTDRTTYMFIANIITRRLYEKYSGSEADLPQLVVIIEEAHKFLDPNIASYTIFDKLARETRKFGLTLGLIDQRPSRIDDEILSQLSNRFILPLDEEHDVKAALQGRNAKAWSSIVSSLKMPTPTASGEVLVMGDAIAVPTVIEVEKYEQNALLKKYGVVTTKNVLDNISVKDDFKKFEEE